MGEQANAPAWHRAQWLAACAVMMAMLLAPAIWNGFPLLQYDTGGYLARWFEGYLVPSRPAAYGLLLVAGVRFGFWPIVVGQAGATLWVLWLMLRDLGLAQRPWPLLAAVTGLSAFTALPWLASMLLTDVFVGLAVIALHLIIFGRTVGRVERAALIALVAFSAAIHSATLALFVALTLCGYVLALRWPNHVPRARMRGAASAVVLGVVITLTANYIVSSRVAFPPGGYGILFGRMLQDGIVDRYLRDHCPDPGLRLCKYRNTLPRDADVFLWGGGLFNQLGRFNGLGDEMKTIVLGSLRAYPLRQATAALSAGARQLVKVETGQGVIRDIWHTKAIMQRYTPQVMPAALAARQQREGIVFTALNFVHVPAALLAVLLLPVMMFVSGRQAVPRPVTLLATSVALAVLANAAICGVLSNPHHRYGSRLIWLAPLTLLLAPLSLRDAGRSRRVSVQASAALVPAPLPVSRDVIRT